MGSPFVLKDTLNGLIQFPSPNFTQMLLILPEMTIATMGGYWGIGVVFSRGRMLRSRIAKMKVVEDRPRWWRTRRGQFWWRRWQRRQVNVHFCWRQT
ncbi:hypothetical protein GIB67_002178 [Kingdonia uniflora]|uniref:Uncharacterized protein n=1 Tax=Kingdonia uniflora TaxID=39325 RepID=A0A7J7KWQ8_9MAGN|nr:hypothetical protein GIB67_002178 [Kingdonia uniflora]